MELRSRQFRSCIGNEIQRKEKLYREMGFGYILKLRSSTLLQFVEMIGSYEINAKERASKDLV